MGFLDKLKDKVSSVAKGHGTQIKSGVDKAADLADKKTGRKYTDKIQTGKQKAAEAVDKLADDDKSAP